MYRIKITLTTKNTKKLLVCDNIFKLVYRIIKYRLYLPYYKTIHETWNFELKMC